MGEPTLLPCPFCGGEVTLGTAESTYWIDCEGCPVATVGGYGKAEQIAAWNARAPTQEDAPNG